MFHKRYYMSAKMKCLSNDNLENQKLFDNIYFKKVLLSNEGNSSLLRH